MHERYEVAIIGGGPAGCFAALLLVRSGCTVAVLDRARRGAMFVGETLPPAATRILAEASLLERFREQGHRPSPGIVSAWGSAEPTTTDFLFSPHGEGWHIDRPRFNALLRDVATEAGAKFFSSTTVCTCMRATAGIGWVLRARTGLELACNVLVDASGRHPSKNLPYDSRIVHDQSITIAGFVEAGGNRQSMSDYTVIDAVRDGWFYSALLPDSRYVITFTTDADVYARGRQRSVAYLNELLAEAPLTSSRVKLFPARTRGFSAVSMQRTTAVQPHWIAVGDAAQSYDPLSGLGLLNAMKSAKNSVAVILDMLAGHTTAAERYESAHNQSFATYLENRTRYYSFEGRWPNSQFWERRRRYIKTGVAT